MLLMAHGNLECEKDFEQVKKCIYREVWGIERSGFFNGREKWAKGFENQRV